MSGCIVPGCNAFGDDGESSLMVEFPQHPKLVERWVAAIEFGTGCELPGQDVPEQRQLCAGHFAGESHPGTINYREPCCFKDRDGETAHVTSCRLCLKFGHRAQMFSKSGKLEHVSLSNTIRAVMKVSLGPDDILTHICERCLVKIDVLKGWARETLQQEMDFRELMNVVRKESELESTIKVEALPVEAKIEVHEEDEEIVEEAVDEIGPVSPLSAVESDRETIVKSEEDFQVDRRSSSSSDEDDKPLAILRRRRRQSRIVKVKAKRGRKPKMMVDVPKEPRKKRGRKPGSPKPILAKDYLRNILDKKCYICNIFLNDNDELVAHLTETHAGKIDYRCDDCKKSFGKVTIYNRHLSCHDITVRPRKCGFCSLCFSAKESLKIHENKAHGMDHILPKRYNRRNKVYQCESCGKIFQTDSLLKQHDMFQHKKLPAATCKLCGKTFATKSNLEKHYIVHSRERPYKCDKCDASYKTSTALTKHSLLHQNVLPYECRYCEERFLTQALYDKHRFLNHKHQLTRTRNLPSALSRSLSCALCSEVYNRSTDLQKHINDLHATQNYPYITCPQCPQQFLQQQQLATHQNIHTDLYVCEVCEKHHSSANQLRDHMESHNPSQPWQCTICLKRFSLQSNFSRHRLIHQDEKRFKCDLCDKGFSQKGQLLNHRRTHTGERPFSCPICGKSFGDQPTFYKHRKRCMEKEGPAAAAVVAKQDGEADGCDY